MKKILTSTLIVVLLAILVLWIQEDRTSVSKVATKLQADGITRVQSVQIEPKSITEWDHNANPIHRDAKPTLVVNMNYRSFTEANEKYPAVLHEISSHLADYKALAAADYVLLNLYRGSELAGWIAFNEKNERSYQQLDSKHLSVLGMGMSLSPEAYRREQQLLEDVRKNGL